MPNTFSLLFLSFILLATGLNCQIPNKHFECQPCNERRESLVNQSVYGKVKSIKTYKYIAYEHWLSKVDKDNKIWEKYDESQEDIIVDLDTDPELVEEKKFNEAGEMSLQILYDDNGKIGKKTSVVFNEDGKPYITRVSIPKSKIETATKILSYTSDGLIESYTEKTNNGPITKFDTEYNDDGQRSVITRYFEDRIQIRTFTYEFDGQDRLTKIISIDSNLVKSYPGKMKRETVYQYNQKGCIIELKEEAYATKNRPHYHWKYEYNRDKCMSKAIELNPKTGAISKEFIFNEFNQIAQATIHHQNIGPIVIEHKYTYDEAGNWIKQEKYNSEMELKNKTVLRREIVYY